MKEIICVFAQQRCKDEDFCAAIDQWNNDSSTGLWRRIAIEANDTVFFCFCPSASLAERDRLIDCFIQSLKNGWRFGWEWWDLSLTEELP